MPTVVLLVPTATYRAADFLAAARVLGADVVVASERRQAMEGVMGDRSLLVDLADPAAAADAIVERHERAPVDAVVAVDDQGVVAAAAACARLGLAHNPIEAVAATRDKAAQRRALASAGIRQPEFRVVEPGADVAALAVEVGLPCVVKPVSLSGSRGVIRADTPEAAAAAADRVAAMLAESGEEADDRLLVEGYVAGVEVAVEGLLRGGRLDVLAVFDKPDPLEGPYFEETLYVTPSRLAEATRAEAESTVAGAARAIGLREGPVHAELRIGGTGPPWVLELAARSIGGLCSRALRFGLGVTLEEVILRHALRLPAPALSSRPGPSGPSGAHGASGVMMLPIPADGVLERVGGRERAIAVPGVEGLEITVAPGRRVRPLPEGDRYLGFLFARAETPEAVEASLRAAHAALEIVISPSALR